MPRIARALAPMIMALLAAGIVAAVIKAPTEEQAIQPPQTPGPAASPTDALPGTSPPEAPSPPAPTGTEPDVTGTEPGRDAEPRVGDDDRDAEVPHAMPTLPRTGAAGVPAPALGLLAASLLALGVAVGSSRSR